MALLDPREEQAIKDYLDAQAKGDSGGSTTAPCSVDGCQMQAREGDDGYCQTHLRQVRMFGKVIPPAVPPD